MRIIAGKLRSRTLDCPSRGVRPTTDRVKESVFATLGPDLLDAEILDLFSGSGNLGIEALSRGAAHATFIEKNHICAKVIKQNIQKLDLQDQAEVIIRDALDYSRTTSARFDIIFVDPPYNKGLASQTARLVYNLLNEEGMAVIEHSPAETIDVPGMEPWKVRCYGETVITYYLKEES